MMKKLLYVLICASGWMFLAIYIKKPEYTWLEYFFLPFTSVMNILVAVGVSYYLTQNRLDNRKKKEIVEKIIEKIGNAVNQEYMYKIDTEEALSKVRIVQRTIDNRLKLLEKYQEVFEYEEELKYIKQEYNGYWSLISNHIEDIEYLEKSQKDLLNYVEKISSKLEALVVKIY